VGWLSQAAQSRPLPAPHTSSVAREDGQGRRRRAGSRSAASLADVSAPAGPWPRQCPPPRRVSPDGRTPQESRGAKNSASAAWVHPTLTDAHSPATGADETRGLERLADAHFVQRRRRSIERGECGGARAAAASLLPGRAPRPPRTERAQPQAASTSTATSDSDTSSAAPPASPPASSPIPGPRPPASSSGAAGGGAEEEEVAAKVGGGSSSMRPR